ncbi:MAG: oxygen-independent coproporphyrinogen III oxidase [Alphaproteobacteria bacterium]
MSEAIGRYLERTAPRYTSYPTALSFSDEVDGGCYASWLGALERGTSLSLYLHIPFCRSMCWFCGCYTKITRRYEPVAAYLKTLEREIDLIARLLPAGLKVDHLHWGGGSPTIIRPDDWMRLDDRLRRRFRFADDAEIGVEIDPRTVEDDHLAAYAATGVTRVSLGVQDFASRVQKAINRVQPFEMTAGLVDRLRAHGIDTISLDLMYGLPHQTMAGVAETASRAAKLRPGRVALFGYAHVPWMKRHQTKIEERALPDSTARLAQFAAAADCLGEAGYVAIGLDHFAMPDDALARAAADGTLTRNFQGYTTDRASALIGLGASAITHLPQGYAQNAAPVAKWRAAIEQGRPATVRGVILRQDDRVRGTVIERLMCDLHVDLSKVRRRFELEDDFFRAEIDQLRPLADAGAVVVEGDSLSVTEKGRPLVRLVAATFDNRTPGEERRSSRVV